MGRAHWSTCRHPRRQMPPSGPASTRSFLARALILTPNVAFRGQWVDGKLWDGEWVDYGDEEVPVLTLVLGPSVSRALACRSGSTTDQFDAAADTVLEPVNTPTVTSSALTLRSCPRPGFLSLEPNGRGLLRRGVGQWRPLWRRYDVQLQLHPVFAHPHCGPLSEGICKYADGTVFSGTFVGDTTSGAKGVDVDMRREKSWANKGQGTNASTERIRLMTPS